MNQKKIKAIRKELRDSGVDVRECKYVGGTKKDKFGRDRVKNLSVAPCMLAACGRDTYKEAKRLA